MQYSHTNLVAPTGSVICVDKIYDGVGCMVHVNIWRECIQTYSMELIAIFHCYVSKSIEILVNNRLEQTELEYVCKIHFQIASPHISILMLITDAFITFLHFIRKSAQ
jgi:hypothetical protein